MGLGSIHQRSPRKKMDPFRLGLFTRTNQRKGPRFVTVKQHVLLLLHAAAVVCAYVITAEASTLRPPSIASPTHDGTSSRNRVANRQTQLRWMAQHVQKTQLLQPYSSGNNLYHDKATNDRIILKGLNQLCTARSVAQVVEAGRWLEKVNLLHQQPDAVVERIVRATALTGLLHLSVRLVDQYFTESPPLMPCQDAWRRVRMKNRDAPDA